jgi:hypothetical protein
MEALAARLRVAEDVVDAAALVGEALGPVGLAVAVDAAGWAAVPALDTNIH